MKFNDAQHDKRLWAAAIAKIVLMFLAVMPFSLQAQSIKLLKGTEGIWKFEAFSPDVVKVDYLPNGYSHNEVISDAVIMKPIAGSQLPAISLNKDTLLIDGLKISPCSQEHYQGFRIELLENEKIYGGGERAIPMNRRGYLLNLYNAPAYGYGMGTVNLNYSVPFFTSSRGYGIFFNNPARGYIDIGASRKSAMEYETYSGGLEFFLFKASHYASILSSYYQLTGTQPLPPRWALGNLMSRFGYTSESEIDSIELKTRQDKIPYDAVIFDLFWFGDSIKGTLGNLQWTNKTKWPDPQKAIQQRLNRGTETILVTEPYFVNSSLNYSKALPYLATDSLGNPYLIKDFYFGPGGLLDIFRKDAKNFFWEFYLRQMTLGVGGWWGDLGEPERHPATIYHNLQDWGFNRKFSSDEVHNIYGHLWTRMLFEKYQQYYPNKRLFSLNRSGFAGTQRYCIFPWSGDVGRNWSGLQAQIPIMLGMALSGIPYAHADAGGFAGGSHDSELYLRWLQFATFTPIFRPHGTALFSIDPSSSSYPSEPALFNDSVMILARKTIRLRYEMLPYNYTMSYRQTTYGEPLAAPLFFYNTKDSLASSMEDEYYWGKDLLVCPILEKNESYRKVYLPQGNVWYAFKQATTYKGGYAYYIKTKKDEIPVFVKASSILPSYEAQDYHNTTEISRTGLLTWNIYPGKKTASYQLYTDDGKDSRALSDKHFELINIEEKNIADHIKSISIWSNKGHFKGQGKTIQMRLRIHDLKKYSCLLKESRKGSYQKTITHTDLQGSYFDFVFSRRKTIFILLKEQ